MVFLWPSFIFVPAHCKLSTIILFSSRFVKKSTTVNVSFTYFSVLVFVSTVRVISQSGLGLVVALVVFRNILELRVGLTSLTVRERNRVMASIWLQTGLGGSFGPAVETAFSVRVLLRPASKLTREDVNAYIFVIKY